MPSEDFLGPVDLATLLTSLKGSVPASFAAYHSELNPGEDEALRAKYGPANFYQHMGTAIPQRNYRAPNPYAAQGKAVADMQDFRMRFPTPEMQKAVIESMNHYAGGGLRKSVQEMAEELLKKGVKTEDKPDLGRRSLFGMGSIMPPKDFPMSIHGDLDKAPKVVQKTTEIVPGGQKSTIESLAQTPTSRRQILSSAASQAVRGALPDLGGLGAMGNVAKIAESVAPAAVSADMAPGLIMAAIKRGMSEEEAVKFVRGQLGDVPPTKAFNLNDPNHVQLEAMYKHLSDPEWAPNEWEFFGPMRPSGALNVMLHTPSADVSPLQLRGALRQIKEADPERYQQLINASKDFSMSTGETAVEMGMISPQDLEKYMKGEHAQPNIRPEDLWSE